MNKTSSKSNSSSDSEDPIIAPLANITQQLWEQMDRIETKINAIYQHLGLEKETPLEIDSSSQVMLKELSSS